MQFYVEGKGRMQQLLDAPFAVNDNKRMSGNGEKDRLLQDIGSDRAGR